jgi:hypothetical protein
MDSKTIRFCCSIDIPADTSNEDEQEINEFFEEAFNNLYDSLLLSKKYSSLADKLLLDDSSVHNDHD